LPEPFTKQSLPNFFADIPDPRRAQGRRHRLSTVLSIAAGATLCGMHGYLAISDWTEKLSQRARKRFSCRYQNKRYIVPSLSTIRDVLIRVDPVHLDRALQRWNQAYGQHDESLAIDGKTMCNAIDDQGYQNHIMNFPHVAQAFVIQREFTDKKTGENSCEIAYGITSRPPEQASRPSTRACHQPRPLEHRKQLSLHYRLELSRRPQPDTNRPWSGKYHALAPFCH